MIKTGTTETFERLGKLEEENKKLKAAVVKAANYMTASCVLCPYDEKLGCERPEHKESIKCAEAVKRYLVGEVAKF